MAQMTLAANVGQGTATFSVTGSRSDGDSRSSTDYTTYQFTATADQGWRFVRWERRSRATTYASTSGQTNTTDWSSWENVSYSTTYTVELICRNAYDYGSGSTWGNGYTSYEYEVRAVFTSATYTVAVVADPVAGGTVTGGGQYQSGATCTIEATAEDDYYFVKWTSSDGEVTTDNPHPFTVTKNITWTAKFHLCTNLLLHGSSDTLLHGSSGTLLHDA